MGVPEEVISLPAEFEVVEMWKQVIKEANTDYLLQLSHLLLDLLRLLAPLFLSRNHVKIRLSH